MRSDSCSFCVELKFGEKFTPMCEFNLDWMLPAILFAWLIRMILHKLEQSIFAE